jgi:predicted metal-dependent phosphotriesterase family hydrolase
MQRRTFLQAAMAAPAVAAPVVMTVRGPVDPSKLGVMLVHEHLFSNFGAEPAEPPVYDTEKLLAAVTPYAASVKKLGCGTVADGTTAWFGRDPLLLRTISERTGLHILTNTGLYGGANDRYVPPRVAEQPARAVAEEWVREAEQGIRDTGIRPGFIKIGVDAGPLSETDAKLVRAGAMAHRRTGLTMTVHTGDNAESAGRQLEILAEEGVAPSAWVWIHANQCKDDSAIAAVARRGAWISLDGLDRKTLDRHVELVLALKKAGYLRQVLLSHDGNSFRAGGKNPMREWSMLFTDLLPALRNSGIKDQEVQLLTVENPRRAYTLKKRLA